MSYDIPLSHYKLMGSKLMFHDFVMQLQSFTIDIKIKAKLHYKLPVLPPSTGMLTPVRYAAAGEHK
ncbi:hypothetical protein D3C71_29380 [compost metagenome]